MVYVSKCIFSLQPNRCRREYSQLNLEQLLEENSIDSDTLVPMCMGSNNNRVPSVSPYLPLEIFDNEDFDCRFPDDWLSLGISEGSCDQKPIPGRALLPTEVKYKWHLVGVLDYDKETSLYLVEKVNLKDVTGNSSLNEQQKKTLLTGRYWVPRIRLLFHAEDPRVFVQRIKSAQHLRESTEALSHYHLSIDCMSIGKRTPSIDTCSLQRIKKYALTTPGLTLNNLSVKKLEEEIKLDYSRTMIRIHFDEVVMNQPEQQFSQIIIPKKEHLVPKKVEKN
uniref:Uncharacterized protein n=1 Tax=Neogobius melanostomus TaxID=47308 RepID=A0A8C6TUX4_9GOBI